MKVPVNLSEEIGRRIGEIIEERYNDNKTLFGSKIGLSSGKVSIVTNGERKRWSIEQLWLLNKACDIDLNVLITGEPKNIMKQEANGNYNSGIVHQVMNNQEENIKLLKDAVEQRDERIKLLEEKIERLESKL